jgi:hypothetical protein
MSIDHLYNSSISKKCLRHVNNLLSRKYSLQSVPSIIFFTNMFFAIYPFGTEEFVQFRQVLGLHRFKLHRHLVEGTVKSVWIRQCWKRCFRWWNKVDGQYTIYLILPNFFRTSTDNTCSSEGRTNCPVWWTEFSTVDSNNGRAIKALSLIRLYHTQNVLATVRSETYRDKSQW